MSSKIEVETRSQEERARIQIRKWEQSMEMGESKNLTSEFAKLRDAFGTTTSSDATQSSDPIMASTKESDEETSPLKQKRQTDWQSMKHHWDVDFKSMGNILRDLEGLYRDKTVEQFNTRKINQLNKRIASKMKEIRGSFAKMKKDVDDLNKKLYSKDETTQYFKDITEWRLAERLATDLTSRLQEKQQTLNRIVLKDKTQAKYIKEAMPGHMQSDDAAGKLQNLFEEFERDQLNAETTEVKEIVEAVQSIVTMVQQMATMITEQGTIVDRIDYNLEVASARTLKGKHFFQKAEKKNQQAGAMAIYCIGVLCIANAVFGIMILMKLKDD